MNITQEEKARWKPAFQQIWEAIGFDAAQLSGGECSQDDVIEWVLDASRPIAIGKLSRDEYRTILKLWRDPKAGPQFRKWLKAEVFPAKIYG